MIKIQKILWCLYFYVFFSIPSIGFGQYFSQVGYNGKFTENIVSPAVLAKKLTSNNATEKEKVASIFRWITYNINYKSKHLLSTRRSSVAQNNNDDTGSLKSLNERVAEKVLEEGEAYCDGYARLFTTLCAYAGIKSEIILGYAKSNFDKVGKNFRSNHSWNAVFIDSVWHLLDVTWASGYINLYGNNYVRHYDEFYFLTPPAQFIRTHYPEDLYWTLLEDNPALKEFETSPFKYMGYYTRYVKTLQPSGGNITASIGDTLLFEVEAGEKSDHLRVVDINQVDSIQLSQVQWWKYPKPPSEQVGSVVKGYYIVTNASVKSLHIVYGNAVIARYNIKIMENIPQPSITLKFVSL